MSGNGKEPFNGAEREDGRSPFERFEAFTKRLVAVPKAEIDALRKREKKPRVRA